MGGQNQDGGERERMKLPQIANIGFENIFIVDNDISFQKNSGIDTEIDISLTLTVNNLLPFWVFFQSKQIKWPKPL